MLCATHICGVVNLFVSGKKLKRYDIDRKVEIELFSIKKLGKKWKSGLF